MKIYYKNLSAFTCLALAIAGTLFTSTANAQNGVKKGYTTKWTQNPYDHQAFIENRGQFNKDVPAGNKVLFQAMLGNIRAYFTKAGVIYRYDESVTSTKKASGNDDPDRPAKEIKTYYTEMQWQGSNPAVEIIAGDKKSDFYTYPTGLRSSINVSLYKKITYRNIYPDIDAEYVFQKNKDGMKYSLIVHPGADYSKIKIAYKGDVSMLADKDGNMVISTKLKDFTEQAPVSYYMEDKSSVASSFSVSGNSASFNITNLDNTKTLVIDPWITNPLFTYSTNSAYDIDYDNQGNVYAYGGWSPLQLVKMNSAGVIQWTFNATTLSTGYYGDFAVDKKTGTSYLTEGFRGSGAYAEKVNTLGSLLATFTGNPNLAEMWRAEYNACTGTIVIAGGGTSASYQACMLDTNMVSITPVNILSATTALHDMSLIAIDPSGGFAYMATARSVVYPTIFNNVVMQLPIPALSPTAYKVSDGYTFEEVGSITYVGGGTGEANGMNGMAASPNWLYMFDGAKLRQVNKSTGVANDSVTVTGTSFQWGGLDVDPCDNVYAGNQTSVNVYNSSLSLLTTLSMPNTVFDVVLGDNNLLYVGGKGFVTSLTVPSPSKLISTTFGSPTTCSACNGKAAVTVNCGIPPYTFNWSNGTTGASDSNLCAGTYTVYVTDGACPPRQDSASVTVLGKVGYTAAVVDTNPNCAKSKGNITVYPSGGTPAYTYTWNTGATTQSDTGLVAGTYNCTITDSAGCKYTVSVTLTNPTTPSISIAPIKDSVCLGFSASLTASGGKTYLWMPGSLSGSTVTVSPATTTTYTVLALDSNGCSGSATATVIVNPPPTISVAPPSDSICKGSSVALKASGGNSYTWKPNTGLTCYNCATPTATPLVNTTWTVTGTDSHGCIDSTTVTVIVKPVPVGTIITKPDTICIGDSATLIAGGGGSYVWTFSGQTSDSVKVGPTTTTTYNLQVTKDGCTSVTSAKVVVVGSVIPTIVIAKDSICKGDSTTITAAGGSSYKWLPGGAITSVITVKPSLTTTYSCIITTACGIDTLTEKLTVLPFPVVLLSPDTTICTGSSAVLKATGGGTYKWTPGGATTSTITVTPGSTQTYSVSVSNGTCAKDTSITVVVNNPPPIDLTPDQVVCQGATVYFADTAKGAFKYLWSNGATTSSITVVPSGNTTYTLVVSNGCLDSAVAHVKVNISGLSACCDTTIITGDTVTIRATGSGNYLWAPDPSSLSCYSCPDPVASPTVTTTYTVTGTDSNGCVADRVVTIFVECLDFTVPNVFTPNNDGINDDLVIKALNPSSYTINIYDRWGKEVYTSNDPTKYWNGDLMSTQYLVPDGVYYYIIKATCGGNNYDKHGFVQVIGGK